MAYLQGFTPFCEIDEDIDDLSLFERIAQRRVIGGWSLGDLYYNQGGRDDERHHPNTFVNVKPMPSVPRAQSVVPPPRMPVVLEPQWGGFPYDPVLLERAGVCAGDIAMLIKKYQRGEP